MLAQRLRAMLALAPRRCLPPSPIERPAASRESIPWAITPGHARGAQRARVALLAGCAQQVLAPEINDATIRLLTRLGVEVVVPRGAGCCGALTHHMGQHDAAHGLRRAPTSPPGAAEIEGEAAWTPSSSTPPAAAPMVKDYGFMFRTGRQPWRAQADEGGGAGARHQRVPDPHRLRADAADPRPDRSPITPRAACSTARASRCRTEGVAARPPASPWWNRGRRISAAARPAPTTCCSRRSPSACGRASSTTCGRRSPDLIAAGNIGCITQLAGGGLPVVHTVELLDWMAGGPEPAAVGGLVKAAAG